MAEGAPLLRAYRLIPYRGFESLPLRQSRKGPQMGPFSFLLVWAGGRTLRFDKAPQGAGAQFRRPTRGEVAKRPNPSLDEVGGAEGDRTPDLRIANATLSHLSYSPVDSKRWKSNSVLCLAPVSFGLPSAGDTDRRARNPSRETVYEDRGARSLQRADPLPVRTMVAASGVDEFDTGVTAGAAWLKIGYIVYAACPWTGCG